MGRTRRLLAAGVGRSGEIGSVIGGEIGNLHVIDRWPRVLLRLFLSMPVRAARAASSLLLNVVTEDIQRKDLVLCPGGMQLPRLHGLVATSSDVDFQQSFSIRIFPDWVASD